MNAVDLSLELDGHRATIRATGYLSLQASENLCILLTDLGRMDILELCLDISQCSPVCVGALETLLDTKFRLANGGVTLEFNRPPHTVSRVFQIMGLGANGELPTDRVSSSRSNS